MNKGIFSIIFIFLFAAVLPAAKSETTTKIHSSGIISLLLSKSEGGTSSNKRLKKRKIKKAVRKVAPVYRKGKTNRSSIKKSRKVQRQARRIINLF